MRRWYLLCALAVGACTVDPIETDVCGNGVIESGEDCDSRARPEHAGQAVSCAAVGQPKACRYTCSRAASPSGCPTGWQCGGDGVCRHASGEYAPAGVAGAVGDLSIGDVDGDGKKDIIVTGLDEVHALFGNGDGSLVQGRIVPAISFFPEPAIGDLDGDGRTDVVTGTLSGFIQAHGQKSRTFLPFAQPTLPAPPLASRVVPIQIASPFLDPRQPSHHMVSFEEAAGGLRFRVLDQLAIELGTGQPLEEHVQPLAAGATLFDLAGVPPRADLDGDGAQEIAVVIVGSSQVRIFSPVHDGRFVNGMTVRTVNLPIPADGNGARFADTTGDGIPDLMVGVQLDLGSPSHVVVAPGLGGGNFGAAAVDTFFDQVQGTPWPLAPIDLGTGRPGWINDFGIFRDTGGAPVLVDFNPTFFWNDAVVGDFNNDGLEDMAATVFGKSGLDVFLQTQAHLFAHTRVVTDRIPTNLRVGDFDGDGTQDLAFRESAQVGLGPFTVSAAFGSPQGLTTPVALGTWADLTSLEPMSTLLAATVFRDGIDDLLVQGVLDAGSSAASLTFMFGSYQRVMLAPYEVKTTDGTSLFCPHVVIGKFDGDDQTDVVALSLQPDPGNTDKLRMVLAMARGTGRGNLSTPTLELAQVGDGPPFLGLGKRVEFGFGCSKFQAIDVDGNGRDDIVGVIGLASFGPGACGELDKPRLVIGLVGTNGMTQFLEAELPPTTKRATPGDVDGDGLPELLIAAEDGAVVVFRDDMMAAPVPVPQDLGIPLGLASIQADADPEPELAVATADGVVIYDVVDRTFVNGRRAVDGFHGSIVVAADIDGDLLDDLIVQDALSGELHAFSGVPNDQVLK